MDTSKLQEMYKIERDHLNSLCERWQKILDNSTRRTHNEDTKGSILTVLGQSRLLLNKKLKQFEQLLSNAEGVIGDMPPISISDLEGFWEVVMIQVNDVYAKFAALEESNAPVHENSRTSRPTAQRPQRSANLYPKSRGKN